MPHNQRLLFGYTMHALTTPLFSESSLNYTADHLRFVTVRSRALGRRADMTLFVPPDLEGRHDVPLMILLHGVYSSHWAWTANGGVNVAAMEMIRNGEMAPLVIAMPSDGLWGDGAGYVALSGQDGERWIAEEVPNVIRNVIPQVTHASPLLISGHSMGGFGAMRIGARYGKQFRAISAHSAVTTLAALDEYVNQPLLENLLPGQPQGLLDVLRQHADTLPRLRFDCGVDDPLLAANRELHAALVERKIDHTYEEFPGEHNWAYWETHIKDTLRFLARVLREEG